MRYAILVPIIRIVFTFRKIARLAIYKYNDNQPFGHENTPHIDRNRKTKNEKKDCLLRTAILFYIKLCENCLCAWHTNYNALQSEAMGPIHH